VRDRSDTPLQALTLLNDTVFVKCARDVGRRALIEQNGASQDRIAYAFRLCLGRQPTTGELDELTRLYDRVEKIYQMDPTAAGKVAGNTKTEEVPVADAAAWTVLARTILNLDEVITRE
jgi:hypothetical protein